MNQYSFKDSSGAFTHPLAGTFSFFGQIGIGQFTVEMTTEKSTDDVAADGNVMVSAIAGDNGHVTIEVQQTSSLHSFLLNWYNQLLLLLNQGDVVNWATAQLTLRNLVDGSQHICNGVHPSRIPPKTYAAQGGKITWTLMCADIQNPIVGA